MSTSPDQKLALTQASNKPSPILPSVQVSAKFAVAQSISTSLLFLVVSFIEDGTSVARIHAVCRNWSAFSNRQLDFLWKRLYLRDWEEESATDSCIMTSGSETPWKERYARRTIIENNWTSGKASMSVISLDRLRCANLVATQDYVI